MRSRLIYIRWGRGVRRYKVKNVNLYEKVGKIGRFNIYVRKKKVKKKAKVKRIRLTEKLKRPIQRKRKTRITKKEEDFIARIKGKASKTDIRKEVEVEKKLLKKVQLLPRFDKFKYIKEINPKNKIISNGKVYGNFHALDTDKRDIYLNLMKDLIEVKDERFKNKLYALRRDLLKDGIVIEIDVYGVLNQKNTRKLHFGTLAVVGLMIEEAGFIESDLIGWTGENRIVEIFFDRIVKGLGGQKCYWIRNNLAMDTATITITDVQLRLNYA